MKIRNERSQGRKPRKKGGISWNKDKHEKTGGDTEDEDARRGELVDRRGGILPLILSSGEK